MKDIIHYYEDGGPSDATARESAEMKRQAKDWIKMLKKEFYEEANPLGRQGMYLVLKKKANKVIGNYPTKRFVAAWLRRQVSNQVNRTAPKSAPSIQAVIVSKPNELLQIDYMYFFRHLTGDPIVGDDDDVSASVLKAHDKKLGGKWQGCINAIDCFSRVGYSVPIKGTLTSKKSFRALKEIIELAKKRYGTEIKKIQTDKGSEFMKDFRKGMKDLATEHKGFYNHVFGYTGRSQTQGLVERFNGTLKRLLTRHLNRKTGSEWQKHLGKAVKNYNSNPHRVIRMAPDEVKPDNYAVVKRHILD